MRSIPHKLSFLSIAIAGIVFFLSVFGQVEKVIYPVDKEIEDERIELLESKTGFVKDVPLGGGAHLDFLEAHDVLFFQRFIYVSRIKRFVGNYFHCSGKLFLELKKLRL